MNFYKRHLGDYAKDCGHLSMLEHGAYTLLLDRYYTTERAIMSQQEAYRVCRARTAQERAAVDAVLAEFFVKEEDSFINRRAEQEIAKASHQRTVNQEIGKRGGRPKKTESVSESVSGPEPNLIPSQTPDSRLQTPEAQAKACAARTPAADVCLALKAAGIGKVSPGNLRLTTLLAAGATVDEFVAFAPRAIEQAPAHAFEYVLGAVEGERKRAASLDGKLHQGRMPNKQEALEQRNRQIAEEFIRKMERTDAS